MTWPNYEATRANEYSKLLSQTETKIEQLLSTAEEKLAIFVNAVRCNLAPAATDKPGGVCINVVKGGEYTRINVAAEFAIIAKRLAALFNAQSISKETIAEYEVLAERLESLLVASGPVLAHHEDLEASQANPTPEPAKTTTNPAKPASVTTEEQAKPTLMTSGRQSIVTEVLSKLDESSTRMGHLIEAVDNLHRTSAIHASTVIVSLEKQASALKQLALPLPKLNTEPSDEPIMSSKQFVVASKKHFGFHGVFSSYKLADAWIRARLQAFDRATENIPICDVEEPEFWIMETMLDKPNPPKKYLHAVCSILYDRATGQVAGVYNEDGGEMIPVQPQPLPHPPEQDLLEKEME